MANYGNLLLDGGNLATILNHTLYLQDICDCDFNNLSIVLGAVFNLCQKMVPTANSWDVSEGNNSFFCRRDQKLVPSYGYYWNVSQKPGKCMTLFYKHL